MDDSHLYETLVIDSEKYSQGFRDGQIGQPKASDDPNYEEGYWDGRASKMSRVAAPVNPYMPENNPFAVDHPAPGTPNEMFDGPPHSTPEPMSVPITTKPRQMPGAAQTPGGTGAADEEPEEGELPSLTGGYVEQQDRLCDVCGQPLGPDPTNHLWRGPGVLVHQVCPTPSLTGVLLSFHCMRTGQKFASRFDPAMSCVCGRDDYDLDLKTAADNELSLSSLGTEADYKRGVDAALDDMRSGRGHRDKMEQTIAWVFGYTNVWNHALDDIPAWGGEEAEKQNLIDQGFVFIESKTAMEGDPPWGMVDEFFPDMDLIETSEQFGVPFQEEGPEGLQDQPFNQEQEEAKKVEAITRDILISNPTLTTAKARRVASLTVKKYPTIRTADIAPTEAGVKVGDIFYSSWGYDQTNTDFYEVVGLKPASVVIRKIRARNVATEGNPHDSLVPVPGAYIDDRDIPGPTVKRLLGSPGHLYLKIDPRGVVYAWPWDGTPKYQTGWAFGH